MHSSLKQNPPDRTQVPSGGFSKISDYGFWLFHFQKAYVCPATLITRCAEYPQKHQEQIYEIEI